MWRKKEFQISPYHPSPHTAPLSRAPLGSSSPQPKVVQPSALSAWHAFLAKQAVLFTSVHSRISFLRQTHLAEHYSPKLEGSSLLLFFFHILKNFLLCNDYEQHFRNSHSRMQTNHWFQQKVFLNPCHKKHTFLLLKRQSFPCLGESPWGNSDLKDYSTIQFLIPS